MAILKDLIVHGSSRFLNKIYASEIQTPLIEAEAGIFKKLKADDATVVGLLDVKGQLHTNSWTNSNIATIDGSFYITPTIGSNSGTVSITSSSLIFSGTNYAVSSLYLGDGSSITWPRYSKVLVTGQILSNGEWIPLGTLLGQLNSAATATSISINNIKDNKNQSSNVLATLVSNGTTSSDYRNLKVSLYQRASSSTAFYPLGIYMTATGTNGRTFLDIYGGVEALSNSNNYGGLAEPNVRIGNLQGLPNVGGQSPNGWGIYTDNGYFKGIIAADRGYIGTGSRYWVIANYEDGSNPNNSRSYIYNNTDSVTSTVEGIYLGTDGIRNYKDSTHYVTIKDGVISALGADLSGKIIASSGSIGGWNIGTDTNKSLYHGNQTPGATTTNLVLSPTSATNSNAIGGSSTGLTWFISAGKVFGVTTAGALYATSGKIGGFDIGTTYIKNTKTSYSETTNNGVWVGTDGIGLGKGLFYVTNTGALTAKSGSIAGWSFNTSSLYKTNATPGYNTSTMVISTGTASTNNIGGGGTASKTWMISAGTGFGVTTTGALYCNDAHISGNITATSGTIGGIQLDSDGKLWITDADISGTISGNHIDASSISIGNLNGASNYAQKTDVTQAIDNIKVGGRNLLKGSDVTNTSLTTPLLGGTSTQTIPSGTVITLSVQIDADDVVWESSGNRRIGVASSIVKDGGGNQYIEAWAAMIDSTANRIDKTFDTSFHGRVKGTYTLQGELSLDKAFNLHIQNVTSGTVKVSRPKLEIGNKATDWTPAPEDVKADIEDAKKVATNYITQIDNTGIKITPYDKSGNDYLQLNSDAISMYRNNIETLRIEDSAIRVGKANEAHFSLTSSRLTGYGDNNNVYFDVGQGDNTAIQLFYGNGDRTAFEMGPLVKGTSQFPKGIKSVKKDGNVLTENTDYTIDSTSIWYDIYFEEEPAAYSTITIEYISAYKELLYTVGSSQNITTSQQTFPDGRVATLVTLDSQKTYKAKELWVKKSGQEEWQQYNEDSQYHVEQINNNYKYYLYVDTGTQIKLVYFILDDPSLASDPDVQIEEYLWDITHQGSLSLTVKNVYGINSVKVNNTNVNYTSEGPLYYNYLVFNTAPTSSEKIEVEFFTRNYNSQYYSTYLNFSNMNKENSVKGIGAVSFGSENVNKGVFCLVEGASNTVTGYASHAQGYNNVVAGSHSHVGGTNSLALGQNTFVHGDNLQATYLNSAAFGYYNNPENQLFSIGRGNYENAFSINKDGNVQIGGGLLAGAAYEDKKPLFKIIQRTFTAHGIGGNGGMAKARDISIPGYRPIASLGYVITNSSGHPTSSQTSASWCILSKFWIGYDYTQDHQNYKTDSIYYYIWNLNTNNSRQAIADVTFRILYIAQSAYVQQQTS